MSTSTRGKIGQYYFNIKRQEIIMIMKTNKKWKVFDVVKFCFQQKTKLINFSFESGLPH